MNKLYQKSLESQIPKITKFSELPKIKNGLYVFDIDETLIVFDEITDIWWKKNFEKIYAETNDLEYTTNKMNRLFQDIIKNHKPRTTDIEGFRQLEEELYAENNTLILLTSRPKSLEAETYKQIAELPFHYTYRIYFSNEKGLELKKFLKTDNVDTNFESIIFVDDKIYNIEDVRNECPEVTCFQFVPDEYIKPDNKHSN